MIVKEVSIIVSGQWNTSIFSPNWVFKNVFKIKESDEAEVGIDGSEFKIVFKINNLTLVPNSNFVEFKISDHSDDTLLYAANSCIQLIQLLPHTNKLAVGLNYKYDKSTRFDESKKSNALAGYDVSQVTFEKKFETCRLNVIMDNNYTLFNYHHSKPELFKSEHILQYFKESEELWRAL